MLDMNSKLLRNCLDGVSDEVARRQPNPETNSVAFLACHVVDARDYLAQLLGVERTGPQLHHNMQTYAAVVNQEKEPPLSEILSAWGAVTTDLRRRLQELDAKTLDRESPQSFPIEDGSLFGAIVFLLHHESYHIGQIALVRKYNGVGSMRYGHRALLSRP
jgi:uncharacterized damage-inducible protein DinB